MNKPNKIARGLLITFLVLLLSTLVWAVVSLPVEMISQQQAVADNMDQSGVTHPVTAVLLNFRGYDTLLEVGVLLLILIGVWSLGTTNPLARITPTGNPVLMETIRKLVPMLILVAGYLLYVGAFAPGGAFHAGAILGAAGVLLILSGWMPPASIRVVAQLSFIIGLLMFILVGIGTLLVNNVFLQYPIAWAKELILLIEVVATISIGTTLAALFLGEKPATWRDKQHIQDHDQ